LFICIPQAEAQRFAALDDAIGDWQQELQIN